MLSILKFFCMCHLYPLLPNRMGNLSYFWLEYLPPKTLICVLSDPGECSWECFTWIFQIKACPAQPVSCWFKCKIWNAIISLWLQICWAQNSLGNWVSLLGNQQRVASPQSLSDETGCHLLPVSLVCQSVICLCSLSRVEFLVAHLKLIGEFHSWPLFLMPQPGAGTKWVSAWYCNHSPKTCSY